MAHESSSFLCRAKYIAIYTLAITPKLVELEGINLEPVSSQTHQWLKEKEDRNWDREVFSSHQATIPVERHRRGPASTLEEVKEVINSRTVPLDDYTLRWVGSIIAGAGLHRGDRSNPIDMNLEKSLLIVQRSTEEDVAA